MPEVNNNITVANSTPKKQKPPAPTNYRREKKTEKQVPVSFEGVTSQKELDQKVEAAHEQLESKYKDILLQIELQRDEILKAAEKKEAEIKETKKKTKADKQAARSAEIAKAKEQSVAMTGMAEQEVKMRAAEVRAAAEARLAQFLANTPEPKSYPGVFSQGKGLLAAAKNAVVSYLQERKAVKTAYKAARQEIRDERGQYVSSRHSTLRTNIAGLGLTAFEAPIAKAAEFAVKLETRGKYKADVQTTKGDLSRQQSVARGKLFAELKQVGSGLKSAIVANFAEIRDTLTRPIARAIGFGAVVAEASVVAAKGYAGVAQDYALIKKDKVVGKAKFAQQKGRLKLGL